MVARKAEIMGTQKKYKRKEKGNTRLHFFHTCILMANIWQTKGFSPSLLSFAGVSSCYAVDVV